MRNFTILSLTKHQIHLHRNYPSIFSTKEENGPRREEWCWQIILRPPATTQAMDTSSDSDAVDGDGLIAFTSQMSLGVSPHLRVDQRQDGALRGQSSWNPDNGFVGDIVGGTGSTIRSFDQSQQQQQQLPLISSSSRMFLYRVPANSL
jgi:hypothetical protein